MRRRIGVFGGTFDPVHNGHLRAAVELAEMLRLDQLRMIPCHTPPHRSTPVATPEARLAMLHLAIAECPGLQVDERELRRGGSSYSIDTLRSLRAEVGDDCAVCLVVGADAFAGLASWKEWQSLLDHAHIVVIERPGVHARLPAALAAWVNEHQAHNADAAFDARAAGSVVRLELTQLDISASRIRALCAARKSARYLLPDDELDYISRNHIYAAPAVPRGNTG